jgi:hypothetical protein
MKSSYKEYDESYNKDLKIELYYHLGGMNYFTGSGEKRGFYLSVTPVERTKYEGGFTGESYTAFTGTKKLILECSRYSKKSEEQSLKLMENDKQTLIDHVVSKNNLTKKEVVT